MGIDYGFDLRIVEIAVVVVSSQVEWNHWHVDEEDSKRDE